MSPGVFSISRLSLMIRLILALLFAVYGAHTRKVDVRFYGMVSSAHVPMLSFDWRLTILSWAMEARDELIAARTWSTRLTTTIFV